MSNTPKPQANTLDELTVEQQYELAQKVLNMLVSRCHKDETTDWSGFNISKTRMQEHAVKVLEQVKRGVLQPTKTKVRF